MQVYLIFVAILLIMAAVILPLRLKGRRLRRSVFYIGLALLVGGGIFGAIETGRLDVADRRINWPTVDGVVTSSDVVGEHAIRPQVKYSYSVGDSIYAGVSDLEVPGFGNGAKRYDVARKLVAEYEVGKTVPVYYNPKLPSESYLIHHVEWNVYAQLGFAITLVLAGAVVLIFFACRPGEADNKQKTDTP